MKKTFLFLFTVVLISCKTETKQTPTPTEKVATTQGSTSSKSSFHSKQDGDKKKYYDASDAFVYEVKYKDDAFKLRSTSSTLLWKVKLYEDKIKISNNEENTGGYEIKLKAADRAKLMQGETELGEVEYDASAKKNTTTVAATKNKTNTDGPYQPSLLVLLINDIPKDQQEILMLELKEKGY